MKGQMMHVIGQEQHYFGLLQCTWINILLYLSHLLQDKTLFLPSKDAFYFTVYLTDTCEPVIDIEDDPFSSGKTMKRSILALQN